MNFDLESPGEIGSISMAEKTTGDPTEAARIALGSRLKDLRLELFGEHGGPEMARLLDLPARTWYDCETGETIPGEVLVLLVGRTEVCPTWLLTGRGSMSRPGSE